MCDCVRKKKKKRKKVVLSGSEHGRCLIAAKHCGIWQHAASSWALVSLSANPGDARPGSKGPQNILNIYCLNKFIRPWTSTVWISSSQKPDVQLWSKTMWPLIPTCLRLRGFLGCRTGIFSAKNQDILRNQLLMLQKCCFLRGGKGSGEEALVKWYLTGILLALPIGHFIRFKYLLAPWAWSLFSEPDRVERGLFPSSPTMLFHDM